MNAGQLNESIEIYTPVRTKNQYGEEVETMTKTYETRAHIDYRGGGRNVENDETVFNYSKDFHVRFYVPVQDNCHIKYGGKMYRITNIEPIRQYAEKIIHTELINE